MIFYILGLYIVLILQPVIIESVIYSKSHCVCIDQCAPSTNRTETWCHIHQSQCSRREQSSISKQSNLLWNLISSMDNNLNTLYRKRDLQESDTSINEFLNSKNRNYVDKKQQSSKVEEINVFPTGCSCNYDETGYWDYCDASVQRFTSDIEQIFNNQRARNLENTIHKNTITFESDDITKLTKQAGKETLREVLEGNFLKEFLEDLEAQKSEVAKRSEIINHPRKDSFKDLSDNHDNEDKKERKNIRNKSSSSNRQKDKNNNKRKKNSD